MKVLIKNGLLIDPANHVFSKLNILLDEGKVASVTKDEPEADQVIDAEGKIVCPGFVDIHMHEDPVEADGKIYHDEEKAIFNCMLRMGVTTAIGGNCGENCCDPGDYLDIVDRDGIAVNVGMMAGHQWFREAAGAKDKYGPATKEQKERMALAIEKALDRGCMGVSYGIRYIPGLDRDELLTAAAPCQKSGKMVAAHIRDDAEGVFMAAEELLDVGRTLRIPVEVSHIGSMAGFGQMERFLAMIDENKMNGLDVSCDCYPYYAYSTHLGSTSYDDGWLDRYHCDYDVLELCEGKYKGQRCTKEIFEEERKNNPNCMTVCYVMVDSEVDMALRHPNVMLGSDGIMNHGQGHPRAAGAFPRLLAEFVKKGKLGLYDAINKVTAMPAEKLGLENKGRLNVGADADVVIFDPEKIKDGASFREPVVAPQGIDYVFIAGEIAAKDSKIVRGDLGKSIRK